MFTAHLGSVEKVSPEEGVRHIANHVRTLQEELEYRLAHLDSSNINEIDANETPITGGIIETLTQSVGAQGESISTLQQTAGSLTARVESAEGKYAALALTVDGFTVKTEEGETRIDGGCISAGSEISAPIIRGGEVVGSRITGAQICGGVFSDLEADSSMKLLSVRQDMDGLRFTSNMMAHYVGDASSSVPLTAMGWSHLEGETGQWSLSVLGQPVLKRLSTGLVQAMGYWDFSQATVYGL